MVFATRNKLMLLLCGLSLIIQHGSADIQKISSSVIRNETIFNAFFKTADINDWIAFHEFPFSTIHFPVLVSGQLQWADVSADIEADIDINVIPDNEVRLYFTALDKRTNRKAIGVAMADALFTGRNTYRTLYNPLIVGQHGEDLSLPSLYTKPNGDLVLFYYNSSAVSDSHGNIYHVALSRDGISVTGTPSFTDTP